MTIEDATIIKFLSEAYNNLKADAYQSNEKEIRNSILKCLTNYLKQTSFLEEVHTRKGVNNEHSVESILKVVLHQLSKQNPKVPLLTVRVV